MLGKEKDNKLQTKLSVRACEDSSYSFWDVYLPTRFKNHHSFVKYIDEEYCFHFN